MEIYIDTINNIKVAEIRSGKIEIESEQDALDLFANAMYQGSNKIILQKKHLTEDLFDLKNGIAGAIFQKCSNYRVKLAIVGDFSIYQRKSLRDFIRESNRYGQINFVSSIEEAQKVLTESN